jgi:hypothetical protein
MNSTCTPDRPQHVLARRTFGEILSPYDEISLRVRAVGYRRFREPDFIMNTGVPFNADATCAGCGRFGAYEFDGQRLCAECYEQHGSCCPEFGRDEELGAKPAVSCANDAGKSANAAPRRGH